MITHHISLPEDVSAVLLARVEADGYANASEYLHKLIDYDTKRREALEQAIIDGDESGESPYTREEIFNRVMDRRNRNNGEDVQALALALQEGEESGESTRNARDILRDILAAEKNA